MTTGTNPLDRFRGDEDDGGVVGELFVSRGNASPLLESIDTSLDNVSLAIASLVKDDGSYGAA
jgi:hypothetical protein